MKNPCLQVTPIRLPLALIEDPHVGRAGRQGRDMLQLGLEDLSGALGASQGFLHLKKVLPADSMDWFNTWVVYG